MNVMGLDVKLFDEVAEAWQVLLSGPYVGVFLVMSCTKVKGSTIEISNQTLKSFLSEQRVLFEVNQSSAAPIRLFLFPRQARRELLSYVAVASVGVRNWRMRTLHLLLFF